MFKITTLERSKRVTLDTADSFEAAKDLAHERFTILHFEQDDDFTDCADFFTDTGIVGSIEPIGMF
ncbi:hypothetical protein [Alterisphingorhabdus coralli]|uniref:Uncharacterized protein n=1 Tax=Alterisphingorhabdus coralli TaxID=3071408 RepID=A0AA97I1G1_9SPHN|nr:hypothetical protein [Parasphingorhabdus sp. SCSIO 66989]WOE76714.1 hypothetical protein RB602_15120 [Parasphingorhabdus sp. SCSIO 66989]